MAERAGRTLADLGDDRVLCRARGIHEGLLGGSKNGGEIVRAIPGVLTDAAIIVNREIADVVVVATVGDAAAAARR